MLAVVEGISQTQQKTGTHVEQAAFASEGPGS